MHPASGLLPEREYRLTTASVGLPLKGRRLMIVEDQAIIAMDVQTTLSELGAEFVAWANGLTQGRNLLETEGPFDLALLDLQLGSENGTDLLGELDDRAIPVVLTSGYLAGEKHLRDRAMLEKPYEQAALIATILTTLEKAGEAR